MSRTIRNPEEIGRKLGLSTGNIELMTKFCKERVIGVTKYQLGLMDPGDPNCPIMRMFLPLGSDIDFDKGEWDTSGEAVNTKMRGVQHKYRETVVFLATNQCAAFCGFCFRKRATIEKRGKDCSEILVDTDAAVDYVKRHKEVSNVLITGGDPLTLSPKKLERIIEPLTKIKHLDFIRIGTRLFSSDPGRLTGKFLDFLAKHSAKKNIKLITHFNHPKEVSRQAINAVNRAISRGFQVYSQTVFLNGVNDDDSIIVELMKKLTRIGVIPYYIFQCRPVKGNSHYSVPFMRGFKIIQAARSQLSGPAKLFNFSMSHKTGKMEIINVVEMKDGHGVIELKYHQEKDLGQPVKIFRTGIDKETCWLPDKLGI